jgi:Meiotically up-regulated gene 113
MQLTNTELSLIISHTTGKLNTVISEERKQKIQLSIDNSSSTDFTVLYDYSYRSGSDSYLCLICNIDRCITFRSTSSVVRSIKSCECCLINKYKSEIESKGFIFISRYYTEKEKATVLNVKCPVDGNTFEVKSNNLFNQNKLHCEVCRQNSYVDSLNKKNCKFLSKRYTDKFLEYITYSNNEGRIFERSAGNILKGSFASDDSHWDQPHSVYLIKVTDGNTDYYKIGTANDPKTRLIDLKLTLPSSVMCLDSFESRHQADLLEKELHKFFNQYRLDKSIASSFTNGKSKRHNANKFVSKDGITEWFTSEIISSLSDRFNLNINKGYNGIIIN